MLSFGTNIELGKATSELYAWIESLDDGIESVNITIVGQRGEIVKPAFYTEGFAVPPLNGYKLDSDATAIEAGLNSSAQVSRSELSEFRCYVKHSSIEPAPAEILEILQRAAAKRFPFKTVFLPAKRVDYAMRVEIAMDPNLEYDLNYIWQAVHNAAIQASQRAARLYTDVTSINLEAQIDMNLEQLPANAIGRHGKGLNLSALQRCFTKQCNPV